MYVHGCMLLLQNLNGEWECNEEVQSTFPQSGNNVLSHVVYHLHELLAPAQPCRPVSSLPNFSLKACCIGKPFGGKSTTLRKVSKGVCVSMCVSESFKKCVCVCVSVCLSVCQSVCLYVCLSM